MGEGVGFDIRECQIPKWKGNGKESKEECCYLTDIALYRQVAMYCSLGIMTSLTRAMFSELRTGARNSARS